MPSDSVQQALEAAASADSLTRVVAIVCADWLIYLVALVLIGALIWRRDRLTVALLVRIVILAALAFTLSLLTGALISDPRPFIVTHTQPLTNVTPDNGFPSDHVLLAATMTAVLWWIDRRLMILCALLTLLIMLGRLAIGAHHTLDVIGSVVLVLVAFLVANWIPLPTRWSQSRSSRMQ